MGEVNMVGINLQVVRCGVIILIMIRRRFDNKFLVMKQKVHAKKKKFGNGNKEDKSRLIKKFGRLGLWISKWI